MLGLFSKATTLLAVLLAINGVAAATDKNKIQTDVTQLRGLELEPPYVDDGFQMKNYDYGGDTVINTINGIRLTSDMPSRSGWVWSSLPLPNDYWKVEFDFRVHGKGGYLFGDGFGFFVTKDRGIPGPVFGNRDHFNGLGVFFDTYANGKHDFSVPFVMGMVGDGKTSYDGAHDGDMNRRGMCEAYFRNLKENSKAAVTYYKGNFVNVQLQLQPTDKWINCFTIANVTIPDDSYLGFTALTGDISDNHDLVSVRVETMRPEALKNMANHMPSNFDMPVIKQSGGGSFVWTLFKILLLAGACGGLYVGYKKYAADNARRF